MYQLCSKTVMDSSDPSSKFINGVSDHYLDFKNYVEPNWDTGESGKKYLERIVAKIKKEGFGKPFDCILGLSGGLDSSYMLHFAVKVLGLRPLVFHVDGGWNTEFAVHNIGVMVEKLNVDLYTEVINWQEMKDFQLAFLKSGVPHIDIPQDHAFIATLYKFADKNGIKYILNGGNFSTECVQYPMKYYYYGTDMIHLKDIMKKFGTIKMKSYPFSNIFYHKIYLRYFRGVQVLKLLNYTPFIKSEAEELLQSEYGWKPYPQKHFESRFTRFFEGYWLPKRFGFDPRRVMLSSLILTNQITRDEAIAMLDKPAYDLDMLHDDLRYIADKLDISLDELNIYFEMPRKYYWDYRNQQSIFKLGAKLLRLLGIEKVKKRAI
jgi:N-acetyl sugar amidotransferase